MVRVGIVRLSGRTVICSDVSGKTDATVSLTLVYFFKPVLVHLYSRDQPVTVQFV